MLNKKEEDLVKSQLQNNYDFHGRRITNAGRSQANHDYVIRAELIDLATTGRIGTDATSNSGTYTPTAVLVANLVSVTFSKCQWNRVGNTVSISGEFVAASSAEDTLSVFEFNAPILSRFEAYTNCGGAGARQLGHAARIFAKPTETVLQCEFVAASLSNETFSFSCMYRVVSAQPVESCSEWNGASFSSTAQTTEFIEDNNYYYVAGRSANGASNVVQIKRISKADGTIVDSLTLSEYLTPPAQSYIQALVANATHIYAAIVEAEDAGGGSEHWVRRIVKVGISSFTEVADLFLEEITDVTLFLECGALLLDSTHLFSLSGYYSGSDIANSTFYKIALNTFTVESSNSLPTTDTEAIAGLLDNNYLYMVGADYADFPVKTNTIFRYNKATLAYIDQLDYGLNQTTGTAAIASDGVYLYLSWNHYTASPGFFGISKVEISSFTLVLEEQYDGILEYFGSGPTFTSQLVVYAGSIYIVCIHNPGSGPDLYMFKLNATDLAFIGYQRYTSTSIPNWMPTLLVSGLTPKIVTLSEDNSDSQKNFLFVKCGFTPD